MEQRPADGIQKRRRRKKKVIKPVHPNRNEARAPAAQKTLDMHNLEFKQATVLRALKKKRLNGDPTTRNVQEAIAGELSRRVDLIDAAFSSNSSPVVALMIKRASDEDRTFLKMRLSPYFVQLASSSECDKIGYALFKYCYLNPDGGLKAVDAAIRLIDTDMRKLGISQTGHNLLSLIYSLANSTQRETIMDLFNGFNRAEMTFAQFLQTADDPVAALRSFKKKAIDMMGGKRRLFFDAVPTKHAALVVRTVDSAELEEDMFRHMMTSLEEVAELATRPHTVELLALLARRTGIEHLHRFIRACSAELPVLISDEHSQVLVMAIASRAPSLVEEIATFLTTHLPSLHKALKTVPGQRFAGFMVEAAGVQGVAGLSWPTEKQKPFIYESITTSGAMALAVLDFFTVNASLVDAHAGSLILSATAAMVDPQPIIALARCWVDRDHYQENKPHRTMQKLCRLEHPNAEVFVDALLDAITPEKGASFMTRRGAFVLAAAATVRLDRVKAIVGQYSGWSLDATDTGSKTLLQAIGECDP
ncbi:hypothetical protein J8273_0730 [Carpediemonas membranifera]|uniref:Uncharacterized protein n=1 Tax=Carpediemonas membranifera TaxID=201153 RepID=A0A8J6EBL1_9EUKA|nr:hypothetical protein J8273_0730 [Carpediemonas membranifera]|eukprot:KAG9397600.1 hypothetical protein J8273_0730 [Carpediemonas membranifera]